MNRKQIIVLWLAIGIIATMCLFPPWTGSRIKGFGQFHRFGQHHIDTRRLAIQIAPVALVAGGLIVTLQRRKK